MKKLTLVAMMFITLISANFAFASEPTNPGKETKVQIMANPMEQKKVVIRVINPTENKKAYLKIKDARGRLLHAETIHKSPLFIQAYDFSEVYGSTYIVEVRTKKGTISQTFEVQEASTRTPYFKPVVKVESGKINVVFQNKLSSLMFLNLRNQKGEIIYKTRVPSQEVFAAGLDVSGLRDQPYSLHLWGRNYSYDKAIDQQ